MSKDDTTNPGTHNNQVDRELEYADAGPEAGQAIEALTDNIAHLMTQALEQTRMAICITDPRLEDSPIVAVNQAFCELTGYDRDEVIGRNCRFLQGGDTEPAALEQIRDAIAAREVRVIELVNYRKDGTAFWNSLHIGPIFDDTGQLTHFYGSQWDVTDLIEERHRMAVQKTVIDELNHRTENLFGVVAALISLTAREEGVDPEITAKITARVDALRRAHSATLRAESKPGGIQMSDLAALSLAPHLGDAPRVRLDGDTVQLPRATVTPIGLTLYELSTNAVKYGALSASGGTVTLGWQRDADTLVLTWRETGGPPVPEDGGDVKGGGLGSRLIDSMIVGTGGDIAFDWQPTGLVARITVPLS